MSPKEASTAGRHFAPASLTRFGGFGDLDVEPVWQKKGRTDDEKLLQAQAQDRLVRRLREAMALEGINDAELESRLGYKPRALVRKLKGYEQMTLKDVLRIGGEFGSEVISALAGEGSRPITLSEAKPKRPAKGKTREQDAVAALYAAADQLEAAADEVAGSNARFAETMQRLSDLIVALAKQQS